MTSAVSYTPQYVAIRRPEADPFYKMKGSVERARRGSFTAAIKGPPHRADAKLRSFA